MRKLCHPHQRHKRIIVPFTFNGTGHFKKTIFCQKFLNSIKTIYTSAEPTEASVDYLTS